MARTTLLLSVLLALSTTSALSQTIRGTITDSLTGIPVRDALVALVGDDGITYARSLSLDGGAFAMTAPSPGRYSIRAKRIGYRAIRTGPFDIAEGEVRRHDILAPTARVQLPSVTVLANRHCMVRPGDGVPAFHLWEEVRTALYQTSLAQRGALFKTTARRWTRELDTLARFVQDDSSWVVSGMTQAPFASVPAEYLDRVGFIERKSPDTWYYYAPDAEVLLSEVFLRRYCFRVVEGDDGLIGLAFEPAKKRRVSGIAGVLWLDAETAALQHLEFQYTKLPSNVPRDRLGGRVEFEQLASGLWIVRRWYVRAPRMATVRSMLRYGGSTHHRSRQFFISIIEHGGEVLETRALVRHASSRSAITTGGSPSIAQVERPN
ncbi:MAG: carboxypeptidase-like regulatory domain-containing protein [Gemmatimonadaceae bacterium]